MGVLRLIGATRDLLILILTPLILLPIVLCVKGNGTEPECAYIILVMAVYWVTEALPINVTGLLPVFMFPMFGVMSSKDVACAFFKSTTLLFLGSFMVASAIEKWDIHKRIALRILLTVGSKPVWLMLGLMLSSWFLSIWISNMSTTAMMLPIATAIVDELRDIERAEEGKESTDVHISLEHLDDEKYRNEVMSKLDVEITVKDTKANGFHDEDRDVIKKTYTSESRWRYLQKAFALCICYASNIGGIGGPTGTLPNVILYGQIGGVYEKLGKENPITFANWLLFGIPTSLVINIASWLWLSFYFLRCRGLSKCCLSEEVDDSEKVHALLKRQYKRLGKFSFGQIAVTCHFVGLIVLWITLDLGGSYGWSKWFQKSYVKGAVPAMLVGVSLFMFPSSFEPLFRRQKAKDGTVEVNSRIKPLMSWNDFSDKMPWGVIFLFGGGFTIAAGAQDSGLSTWIGNSLTALSHLQPTLLLMVLCFIVAAATELTTNAATASLILPIIADLAKAVGMEPVYLMLPVTVSSSFAFMLPVANPPNAFVFATGIITIPEMAKAGFVLNIIGVLILMVSMETLGKALYL